MHARRTLLAFGLVAALGGPASALTTKLDYIYSGNQGPAGNDPTRPTVVFVHGMDNCVTSTATDTANVASTDCSGNGSYAQGAASAVSYWQNQTKNGGNGDDFIRHATTRVVASGTIGSTNGAGLGRSTSGFGSGTLLLWDAFTVRYDALNQGVNNATNDVAACLADLAAGTNASGCNPSLYHRAKFNVVAHSMGGAVMDHILSQPSRYPAVYNAVNGVDASGRGVAVISIAGALAGSWASSALWGVDGANNFCVTLVSWLANWALKNLYDSVLGSRMNAASLSLTRGNIHGDANNGYAGKSSVWIYKLSTAGGFDSANNNSYPGWGVNEHVNDSNLGSVATCVGKTSTDDSDGLVWNSDSDPSANPSANNGGNLDSAYTGLYWHWLYTWSNHMHVADDAYSSAGCRLQTQSNCDEYAPGTCVGFALASPNASFNKNVAGVANWY